MSDSAHSMSYRKTILACFIAYIVQAIVNNFAPLLFVTFGTQYGLSLSQITAFVTINFCIQLVVDLISVKFVDRIGYKNAMLLAHALSSIGLVSLAILPDLLPNPYIGILLSVFLYAIGGGLLEVVVSPVVEACPTPNKEAAMSLLHSFYCWGHVGVVLFSSALFAVFGISHWKVAAVLWALVPLGNLFFFLRLPVPSLCSEATGGLSLKSLLSTKLFWLMLVLMVCSGACEQSVSQWASAFAEKGLGLSKALGDLTGPMFFAITMGTARTLYGKFGDRIPLKPFMIGSGLLCLASYLLISLSPVPLLSLIGCGICGFSVGILWPGTFSLASASIPKGGTAMFALLALGGDLGCSSGPTFVGFCSGIFNENLHMGILCAIVFPVLLLIGLSLLRKTNSLK